MAVFSICDGRTAFWQWDLGQRLVVADEACHAVHFCNGTTDCALVCKVFEEGGRRLVNVPNVLLQTGDPLRIFTYIAGAEQSYTAHCEMISVLSRAKPADYIYTETEVVNFESLKSEINTELEQMRQDISAIPKFDIEVVGIYPIVNAAATSGSIEVAANTVTNIDTLTGAVDISIGAPKEGFDNEWVFIINEGSTAHEVTVPSAVNWTLGIAPAFGANSVTEIRLHYKGSALEGVWNE